MRKKEECESDLQKVKEIGENGAFGLTLYETTKQKCEKTLTKDS
jgi:hypothetical protein